MKLATTLLLLLVALLTTTAEAQNWIVGEQVDLTFTQISLYGSGCAPDADEALNFPGSTVSGVDHIAVITSVNSAGPVIVIPGPTAPLSMGDTIWLTGSVIRNVVFTAGAGAVELKFKAVGTPTMAGQPHPCTGSDLWVSDLGICPETLSLLIENDCTTENSTGITDDPDGRSWFTAPSAANGGRVEVHGASPESIRVMDLQGRMVSTPVMDAIDGASMNMDAVPAGIYVICAIALNGELLTRSFPVVH